jgi:hypothetical protein
VQALVGHNLTVGQGLERRQLTMWQGDDKVVEAGFDTGSDPGGAPAVRGKGGAHHAQSNQRKGAAVEGSNQEAEVATVAVASISVNPRQTEQWNGSEDVNGEGGSARAVRFKWEKGRWMGLVSF